MDSSGPMGFKNHLIMGVWLDKKLQTDDRGHYIVDVVFVDQSQGPLYPILYKLHSETVEKDGLKGDKPSLYRLPQGSIIMLGEVDVMDQQKKCIFLKNGKTVTYKHLVITTGMKHPHEEFSVALQSLIDALSIQKKIPGAFKQKKPTKSGQTPLYQPVIEIADANELREALDKIQASFLPTEIGKGQSSLSETKKRLFYLTS
jgi:NADH dehydrogenase FAD-containing subunit